MEYKNKYNLTTEENIFLAKRNIVDYIYKSAKLEGIAVTYPETEVIYEGFGVDGVKISDIQQIINLKHAWNFILDTIDYPLDFKYISQIHKEIRNSDVKMGGTLWKPELPNKEEIEMELNEIFKSIEPFNASSKALDIMLYLMRKQIFYDGNKRTATMLANKIMIKNGCGIISIPSEYLKEFRDKLIKYYETNNKEDIKEFLYNYCIDGIILK